MSGARPRIPETLSVAELAHKRTARDKSAPAQPSTEALRSRLARESLEAAGALPAAKLSPAADYPGFMRLRCDDVDLFDRNPRTSLNPRYVEIRESIIERGGLHGPLMVTRRPGSARYMLYMGGNTRLKIVQDLWHETRDPRYEWINCSYHAWVSEADVIAAHLIENEARSDTSFFEKAGGLVTLKEELEKQRGKALTLRELAAEARALGMKVSASTAMNYLFAVTELAALGPLLTHDNVNAIRAHAGRHDKTIAALGIDPFACKDAFGLVISAAAARLLAGDGEAGASALNGAETAALLDALDAALADQAGLVLGQLKTLLAEVAATGTSPSAARIQQVRDQASRAGGDLIDPAAAEAGTPAPDSRAGVPEPPADAAPAPVQKGSEAPAAPEAFAVDAVPGRSFVDELAAFAAAFEIDSLLRSDESMPHGFYMEFPGDYFELLPADAAIDPALRRAAYLYLVALSRQLEPQVAGQVPLGSLWRELADADPLDPAGSFEMRYAQSCMGISGDFGTHGMSAHDVACLLCRPEGWARLGALMRSYHAAFSAPDTTYLDPAECAVGQ